MGGHMLAPEQAGGDDVVLSWEGRAVVAVRLPHLADSLERILADLERRHGRPLAELDRRAKQSVVRSLETRGAFTLRHGVETVAAALGVSRFTVYNYINAQDEKRARESEGGS
ncbi:helix-turn-helix domain-containing protein [Streptomyces sp. NPDC026206]|uniref:helix-turn-helix domain-containing protein n=1 Tax=Streptomyces sp. NPDC026206 TaxID=3157089 RepID=UPI0033EF8CC4